MNGSATFTSKGVSWCGYGGKGPVLSASDYPDGTRLLLSGRRYVAVAGKWQAAGVPEGVAEFVAASFTDGTVAQVTVTRTVGARVEPFTASLISEITDNADHITIASGGAGSAGHCNDGEGSIPHSTCPPRESFTTEKRRARRLDVSPTEGAE